MKSSSQKGGHWHVCKFNAKVMENSTGLGHNFNPLECVMLDCNA